LRIRGLRKAFPDHVVLDALDLDVPAGANLILLGASGSGKTVLTKCVLGLIEPDAGSIELDGKETVGLGAQERDAFFRRIGVLFQNGALFDSLPVWQNISFGLVHGRHHNERGARDAALTALSQVGLEADVADLLPDELSGGMQKRVALARAIVGEPEILFLDNPTAGLDPIVTTHIDNLIISLLHRNKVTAVTITHDLASAMRVGDRAAFLANGRIEWEGTVHDLATSGNPAVARYVRSEVPIGRGETR
jgi:phospholipid/cholesterol/gamma-HCH transport system ATP-binding protein